MEIAKDLFETGLIEGPRWAGTMGHQQPDGIQQGQTLSPFAQSSLNGTYAQFLGLQYKTSYDELEQEISGGLSRCFRDGAFALQREPGVVPPGDELDMGGLQSSCPEPVIRL